MPDTPTFRRSQSMSFSKKMGVGVPKKAGATNLVQEPRSSQYLPLQPPWQGRATRPGQPPGGRGGPARCHRPRARPRPRPADAPRDRAGQGARDARLRGQQVRNPGVGTPQGELISGREFVTTPQKVIGVSALPPSKIECSLVAERPTGGGQPKLSVRVCTRTTVVRCLHKQRTTPHTIRSSHDGRML